jgi:GNAT superfamily N-acetyltransferase
MTEPTIRLMKPRDLPAGLKLSQGQSWSHRLEDWEFHFRLSRGWVVADANDQAIGTALWWAYGRDYGSVGLVLVEPQHQGKGFGRKLMHAVLSDAGARSLQLVATSAGLKLYQQCGFRERSGVSQHQGNPTKLIEAPPPPGVTLRAASREDLVALVALDEAAFGASRREVIGAVFGVSQGVLAEQEGRVVGFALMRTSGRGSQIGPVVAEDQALATALISYQLKTSPGFTRVDLPSSATQLATWLDAAGLACVDQVTTMVRGDVPNKRSAARAFALVSQAFS